MGGVIIQYQGTGSRLHKADEKTPISEYKFLHQYLDFF